MNSEYLFEKKGSDPDIERMEGLLSAYRIEPVAPALARAEHVEMPQPAHKRFRFVFAYAGAFAVFAVLITAGLATSGVPFQTAHRRFSQWTKAGLWRQLHRAVPDELGSQGLTGWSRAIADAACVRAKKGAP